MIKHEYDIDTASDVMRDLLMYEARMTKRLEQAQATVDAIRRIIQRAKEQRLDIEVQTTH